MCIMTTGGTPSARDRTPGYGNRQGLGASREVRDAFAKQGVDVYHMGPQQLGKFLHAETARYSSLLEHSRVRPTSQ